VHLRLRDDSASFHPVHPQIRAFGPRVLHHAKGRGLSLGDGSGKGRGKGGRTLSYVATVQGNGNLLIGKAYTALLDLNPGDEFEIKLGRKQIKLIPAGAADEESVAA
jgi:hypothetical protein